MSFVADMREDEAGAETFRIVKEREEEEEKFAQQAQEQTAPERGRLGRVLWIDEAPENNVMLASANTCLTDALLERLRNYDRSTGVRQPVLVEFEVDRS